MDDISTSLTWLNLHHANAIIESAIGAAIEAETGYGASEAYVLVRLSKAPNCCLRMGEIADRLDMAQSGATRLVDRLVERGFVVREQPRENRRTTIARLTDEGREAVRIVQPIFFRVIRERLGEPLDETELADLRRLLDKVIQAAGRTPELSEA